MERAHDAVWQPAPRPAPPPLLYYEHDGVRVTSADLEVEGRHYAIGHLRHLRTGRGRRDLSAVHAALASIGIAAALLLAARYLDMASWVGAGAVLAVLLVVLAGMLLHRPRPYQLWAEYHGATVRLLSCPQAQRYHQICRAVLRAKEAAEV
jgi:hypothetical protein